MLTTSIVRHVLALTLERCCAETTSMRPMHGTAGQMAGAVKSKRIPRIVGRERWKPATQSWRPWARRPVKDPEKDKLGRENTAIVNRTVTLSTVPPGNLDTALASPIPPNHPAKDRDTASILSVPHHKSKDRRSRIKRYCSHLTARHLSTISTEDLLGYLDDLRHLESHIKPEEGWTKGTWPDHTALRHITMAGFRVLQELKQRITLDGVVQQADFDPIILSLIYFAPPTRPSDKHQNSAGPSTIANAPSMEDTEDITTLDLPYVLRFMASIHIPPSTSHLQQIASSRSTRLLRPTDHAQHYRSRLALTYSHLGSSALQLWADRQKIVQSTLALYPQFEETPLYEREVCQSMDEVDILTLGRYDDDVVELLREGMDFWMGHRDKLIVRKRQALQGYVKRWKDLGVADEAMIVRPTPQETKDLCVLLRDSLLSRRIRPSSLDHWTAESPNLADPFDLLRLLLGATTCHRTPEAHPSARAVVSSIIRMRNAFYLDHDIESLRKLIRLITPPSDLYLLNDTINIGSTKHPKQPIPSYTNIRLLPPPPLPSAVHATLLCAAHTPHHIRHILIRTYHLSLPLGPVQLGKKTRQYLRNLATRADERDWSSWRRSSDPFIENRDTEVRAIVDQKGWSGLLELLFEKWGEGMSVRQWNKLRGIVSGRKAKRAGEIGEADADAEDEEGHDGVEPEVDLQAKLREMDLARSVTRPKNILERPPRKSLHVVHVKH